MRVSELETPALVIDLDIFERNLKRVAAYAKEHDLRLRPHTKTHKTPDIGRLQLESGAAGLTVAKVGEAEVMMASGTPDLLVAYPVIGRTKMERLAEVARKTNVTVSLDSQFAARQLSEAARKSQVNFGVLAEVDVGMGRVGVAPGEELLQLAQAIERLPRLTFEGIAFYPGHIKMMGEEAAVEALQQLSQTVRGMLDDFRRAGVEVKIVSGGSTPTLYHSHEVSGLNEIRPGTYVYNDVNTVRSGGCTLEDCAASILATVVSTAREGQMIVDGGSKTFSSDRLVGSAEVSFGRVVEAPGCVFHNM
ncbi:MAG: alanine racemase, partial [Bryobacteraceae bacterium]